MTVVVEKMERTCLSLDYLEEIDCSFSDKYFEGECTFNSLKKLVASFSHVE